MISMHFKRMFSDWYAFLNHIAFRYLDALSVSNDNLRSYFWDFFDMQVHTIGNNLKTSKKWNTQGSWKWNSCIPQQEDYKGSMLQMLQS